MDQRLVATYEKVDQALRPMPFDLLGRFECEPKSRPPFAIFSVYFLFQENI